MIRYDWEWSDKLTYSRCGTNPRVKKFDTLIVISTTLLYYYDYYYSNSNAYYYITYYYQYIFYC